MNEAFDVMQMLALGQTRTILKVVHLENKRFKCIYQFYFAMRKHTFTMAVRRGWQWNGEYNFLKAIYN